MQHILCRGERRPVQAAGRSRRSVRRGGWIPSGRRIKQVSGMGKGRPTQARSRRDLAPAVSHLGGCAASARRSCCGARSPVPPACCPCPAWARSTILHSAARFVERRGAGRLQGQARQSGGRGRDGWGVSRSASQEMCQTRNARLEIAKASTKRPL